MRPSTGTVPLRRLLGVGSVLLGVFGGLLGYLSALPWDLGIVVVLAPIALGIGLRARRSGTPTWTAPLPVLAALAWGVLRSPFGIVPELTAGGCGLAFLVWLAEDPVRESGGFLRAAPTVAFAGIALAIAWASALLLPSGSAGLGVAAALLVFAITAVAFLVTRPELFDREAPESA